MFYAVSMFYAFFLIHKRCRRSTLRHRNNDEFVLYVSVLTNVVLGFLINENSVIITGFMDFSRRPEFLISRKRNVSETRYVPVFRRVSETLCF
jgi:hypothetical protein